MPDPDLLIGVKLNDFLRFLRRDKVAKGVPMNHINILALLRAQNSAC